VSDNFQALDGANNPITVRSRDVGSGIQAQVTMAGEHTRVYDGVQTLTLTTTAQSLTVPGSATHATIYCEGASGTDFARYWHGTAPTATAGKKLKDHEEIASASPASFQAIIGTGGGSPKLLVEYYHYQ
jgi:hypothetical protein